MRVNHKGSTQYPAVIHESSTSQTHGIYRLSIKYAFYQAEEDLIMQDTSVRILIVLSSNQQKRAQLPAPVLLTIE